MLFYLPVFSFIITPCLLVIKNCWCFICYCGKQCGYSRYYGLKDWIWNCVCVCVWCAVRAWSSTWSMWPQLLTSDPGSCPTSRRGSGSTRPLQTRAHRSVQHNRNECVKPPDDTQSLMRMCFPCAGVIEKLHEAAYKNALSNSLYCPEHMVGKISVDLVRDWPQLFICCFTWAVGKLSSVSALQFQLQQFVANNYASARMALVGLGKAFSSM